MSRDRMLADLADISLQVRNLADLIDRAATLSAPTPIRANAMISAGQAKGLLRRYRRIMGQVITAELAEQEAAAQRIHELNAENERLTRKYADLAALRSEAALIAA